MVLFPKASPPGKMGFQWEEARGGSTRGDQFWCELPQLETASRGQGRGYQNKRLQLSRKWRKNAEFLSFLVSLHYILRREKYLSIFSWYLVRRAFPSRKRIIIEYIVLQHFSQIPFAPTSGDWDSANMASLAKSLPKWRRGEIFRIPRWCGA